MNVSILDVRKASFDEWDEIWQKCDYATYFHSRKWAELWSLYTDGKMQPHPIIITFSDSKKSLLPLTKQRIYRGFTSKYISSPAETFGGWVSADALDSVHGKLLSKYLTDKIGNLFWRINPYDKLIKCMIETVPSILQYDETQVLYLENGFEAIFKRWTKGHVSASRKAHREGVTIKPANTLDDWYAYYHVYEDSLRRWGKGANLGYSLKLFEDIFKNESSYAKLWLAMHGSTVIAGALCFYAKKHVVYWHGAVLEKYFSLRPVNLLLHEIIRDACDKKYFWFDFNPSGGHEGTKAFKKGFGAVSLSCPVISRENTLSKAIRIATGLIK